jgi:hypothetical protein
MGLARQYNRAFKQQLGHFAAWNPVTDAYAVGDFGGFRDGVFQKLGNIREFGIQPKIQKSATSVGFSFSSTGTKLVRTAAGVTVDTYPPAAVTGTLAVSFSSEYGFFVRTDKLDVQELEAVDAVARQLARTRDSNGRTWKRGWRVVRKVYVATDPVVLGSLESATNFTLAGKVELLQKLEGGKGSLDLQVSSNKASGLQILGGTGPIAFDLFRVRIGGGAGLSFGIGPDAEPDAEPSEPVELELDDDLSVDELDDDAELFSA